MRGLLYGVHPLEPAALIGAVAGIVVVSAVALAVPLRAAVRVDPADVLRAN
jgi:ABC-type antimicrobial peptide transport system permease subunit